MNCALAMGCLATAILAGPAAALAGESVIPRRTFRESRTYPYIFRPEGYLAGAGPAPMRIEPKLPAFAKRLAPPLPAAAKGTEKPVSPAPDQVEEPPEKPPETETHSSGKKDDLPLPRPDLDKVPDAVLGFFKDKDARPSTRLYLFDPIFQPARPNELPKSKALHSQKP